MPISQNIFDRMHARFFPEDSVRFTVRTTPRIARSVMPVFERLIGDDKIGETYRGAVSLWLRWNEPPLKLYQGLVSICRINGPPNPNRGRYLPAGGLVETPGLSARLSSEEANDLDERFKRAIEKTILDWVEQTNRERWKTIPQHQHRGTEDA